MKSFKSVVMEDTEFMTSVNEGWGKFLASMVGVVINGTIFIPAGLMIHNVLSNVKLAQLFKNPKLKKYINDESKKIIKDTLKKNKNLTDKIPQGFFTNFKKGWKSTSFAEGLKYWPLWLDMHTVVLYDTDHIQAVRVAFYDKENDTYTFRDIPEPSKQDLGIRKESYVPTVFNADSIFDL